MASNHPVEDYFQALGLFIHEFAATETLLLEALVEQAGVSKSTARAIFSGVRADTAKAHIKRLREVQGAPEIPTLERAFTQFSLLTDVRNDIVHYGATFRGDWEPHVSNKRGKMPGKERSVLATPTVLRNMATDLGKIRDMIGAAILGWEVRDSNLHWTWLYKSPPQDQSQNNRRKRTQAQSIPPESSPQ